jgi:hypothetical protein
MEHSMSHSTRRLAVIGVVGGTVLTMSSAAVAQDDTQPEKGTGCVVQHVDERGGIVRTETESEGRMIGQFRCVDGQWTFDWTPFGADDAILADEIWVNPSGAVSVPRFTGPALGNDLTLGEVAAIAQAVTGSKEVEVDRAIVAVDDGKQRTPEEIEALLAGEDTTGVRVLGTIEKPDPAKSPKDLIDEVGGTPESTVVYFSLWGAIKGALAWVAGKLGDAVKWIDKHCKYVSDPSGQGSVFTCGW